MREGDRRVGMSFVLLYCAHACSDVCFDPVSFGVSR